MTPAGGNTNFNPFEALNAAKKEQKFRVAQSTGDIAKVDYKFVLEKIQTQISNNPDYNNILRDTLDKQDGNADQLKNLVHTLLQHFPGHALDGEIIDRFLVRILDDMIGFGLITPLLKDPDVEEINVYI